MLETPSVRSSSAGVFRLSSSIEMEDEKDSDCLFYGIKVSVLDRLGAEQGETDVKLKGWLGCALMLMPWPVFAQDWSAVLNCDGETNVADVMLSILQALI